MWFNRPIQHGPGCKRSSPARGESLTSVSAPQDFALLWTEIPNSSTCLLLSPQLPSLLAVLLSSRSFFSASVSSLSLRAAAVPSAHRPCTPSGSAVEAQKERGRIRLCSTDLQCLLDCTFTVLQLRLSTWGFAQRVPSVVKPLSGDA